MKKLLWLALVLQTSALFGQAAYVRSVDTGTISTSGKVFTHTNTIAELNVNVEYVISGSPTITSIILQGCMRGGTCQTLSTYSASTNTVISVTGLYDSYTVTPTWTGGSSPTVTINWLGTSNSSPGGATASILNPCPSSTSMLQYLTIAMSTTAAVQIIPAVAGQKIYVCAFAAGWATGTAPTFLLEYGTGSNCGTGTTALFPATLLNPGATAAPSWNPPANLILTPASQALCYIMTGTTPTGTLVISFVQS